MTQHLKREIKFRAWDDTEKKMFTPAFINEYGAYIERQYEPPILCIGAPLMQSTGLLDKNGTEIYEGDIVSFGSGPSVIKFKNGGFGWDSVMFEGDFIGFAGHVNFHKIMPRCQVLGNIHQNPELIQPT